MEAARRRAADRIGQDVWKWVSGILAAILLTGLASSFAFGMGTLSWAEAERFYIVGRLRLVSLACMSCAARERG